MPLRSTRKRLSILGEAKHQEGQEILSYRGIIFCVVGAEQGDTRSNSLFSSLPLTSPI